MRLAAISRQRYIQYNNITERQGKKQNHNKCNQHYWNIRNNIDNSTTCNVEIRTAYNNNNVCFAVRIHNDREEQQIHIYLYDSVVCCNSIDGCI